MTAVHPTTTLLVTTYNWPAALDLVLRSALAQRVLPSQVVVADDGSRDDTADAVRALVPAFAARGVPLVHAWQPDEGFRAAAVRNLGLARATGEYVLMVDGDCVLHPDFVRSHLAFARPGTFVQGSRVMVSRERSADALARVDHRFGLLDRGIKNRQNGLPFALLSRLVRTPQESYRGTRSCNMGYWMADAVRINGWNERFVGWGREDSEFAARMLAAGVRRRRLKFGGIVYHLYHPDPPRGESDNHPLYEEAVRTNSRWCAEGLDRHLRGVDPSARRGAAHAASAPDTRAAQDAR